MTDHASFSGGRSGAGLQSTILRHIAVARDGVFAGDQRMEKEWYREDVCVAVLVARRCILGRNQRSRNRIHGRRRRLLLAWCILGTELEGCSVRVKSILDGAKIRTLFSARCATPHTLAMTDSEYKAESTSFAAGLKSRESDIGGVVRPYSPFVITVFDIFYLNVS
jgi:hypothetical protein